MNPHETTILLRLTLRRRHGAFTAEIDDETTQLQLYESKPHPHPRDAVCAALSGLGTANNFTGCLKLDSGNVSLLTGEAA